MRRLEGVCESQRGNETSGGESTQYSGLRQSFLGRRERVVSNRSPPQPTQHFLILWGAPGQGGNVFKGRGRGRGKRHRGSGQEGQNDGLNHLRSFRRGGGKKNVASEPSQIAVMEKRERLAVKERVRGSTGFTVSFLKKVTKLGKYVPKGWWQSSPKNGKGDG